MEWSIIQEMALVYLSLGSNLGIRLANLQYGIDQLIARGVMPEKISSVYETAPIGETSEPLPYLNVGLWARTDLQPRALLGTLKHIERDAGRAPSERWSPRTLDIDLVLYDSLVVDMPGLTIPHPRMRERAFVLIPLMEMDPTFVLPDGSSVFRLMQQSEVKAQEIVKTDASLSISSSGCDGQPSGRTD
ncbi:MAG: 2-amino-4-hydroxy-6-hydroxymethyldihydropteridine diphosphokinase [Fimbriimonadia bacterium]|nr:2-amino-4-hydroxy-6-hydroxymethyldihydropteridine diphosphokinase [Fimbriimonadia bacterium]